MKDFRDMYKSKITILKDENKELRKKIILNTNKIDFLKTKINFIEKYPPSEVK